MFQKRSTTSENTYSHCMVLTARARSNEKPRLDRTRLPFGVKESAAPTSPVKLDFS